MRTPGDSWELTLDGVPTVLPLVPIALVTFFSGEVSDWLLAELVTPLLVACLPDERGEIVDVLSLAATAGDDLELRDDTFPVLFALSEPSLKVN